VINHIDVSTVLRRTVCDLYSNLVTRPTGAAVRTEIETQVAALEGRTLTVIDFSNVNLLDFSCADEIVAKLLLRFGGGGPPCADGSAPPPAHDGYFLFRGLHDAHLDAIETVLERHGLALVAESERGAQLVGTVDDGDRRAWEEVGRLGGAAAEELAHAIAHAIGTSVEDARSRLEGLERRRLVMRLDESYVAIGAIGGAARGDAPPVADDEARAEHAR
jgi:hypothetical protein